MTPASDRHGNMVGFASPKSRTMFSTAPRSSQRRINVFAVQVQSPASQQDVGIDGRGRRQRTLRVAEEALGLRQLSTFDHAVHQSRQCRLRVRIIALPKAVQRCLGIGRSLVDTTACVEDQRPDQRCLRVGELRAAPSRVADDRVRCLLRLDHPAALQQRQHRKVDTGAL